MEQTFDPGLDEGGELAWSPDGKHLAIGSNLLRRGNYLARICDVETGEVEQLLRSHTEPIRSLSFHPDGTHILTAAHDQSACIWDLEINEQIVLFIDREAGFDQALYSPSGSQILTTNADRRKATLLDLEPRQIVQEFGSEHSSFDHFCFHPVSDQFASAGEDGVIRIWDIETGAELLSIQAHRSPILDIAYHPAGTHLASAGADQSVRIWEGVRMSEEAPRPSRRKFSG